MIEVWLLGYTFKEFEQNQLNNKVDLLNIDSQSNDAIDITQTLLRDPKESFKRRKKLAHPTFDQKHYIFKSYTNGESLSEIWRRTGISISKEKRIFRDFRIKTNRTELYTKIRWRKIIESTKISEWIADYVREQAWCFTAASIQTHIIKEYSVTIPLHQMRQHLEQVHGLSFKKGNPRPVSLNAAKIKLLKQLFYIMLSQRLSDVKVQVNIDECTIHKDTWWK